MNMKNNRKIYVLLSYGIIISVMLLLFSCGTTVDTPPEVKYKNFAPIEIGNYWVYDTYELNTGNQPIPETISRDSFVVVGKTTVREHETYELHKFVDSKIEDTLYWHKKGETFYYFMDDALIDVPDFRPQFMKMYVPGEEDWHVYDTIFFAHPVQFLGERVDSTETQYTMNAKIIWSDSVEVSGIKRLGRNYQYKMDSRVLFSYYFDGDKIPTLVQRLHLQVYNFNFAENVGILFFEKMASSINTSADTEKYSGESVRLGGTRSFLNDFHVGE